jgi:putative nucleotidyltransferase with HDIG domain
MIPSREECIGLLEKYHVRKSKIDHCLLVEKTAVSLARLFNSKGQTANEILVSRAAILHDIGKDFTKKDHGEYGAQICAKEGVDDRILGIIRNHELEAILDKHLNVEEKIVFYADKICTDRLIGVDKRFAPWLGHNHSKDEEMLEMLKIAKIKTLELEKEILNKLSLTPEQLLEKLRDTIKIT